MDNEIKDSIAALKVQKAIIESNNLTLKPSRRPGTIHYSKKAVESGKYCELCDEVRHDTQAEAVVLVVLNGNDGSGFCYHANSGVGELLPTILRRVAQDISKMSEISES